MNLPSPMVMLLPATPSYQIFAQSCFAYIIYFIMKGVMQLTDAPSSGFTRLSHDAKADDFIGWLNDPGKTHFNSSWQRIHCQVGMLSSWNPYMLRITDRSRVQFLSQNTYVYVHIHRSKIQNLDLEFIIVSRIS